MIYSAQVFALALIAADDTDIRLTIRRLRIRCRICQTIPTGMQRHTRESAQVSMYNMTEHKH